MTNPTSTLNVANIRKVINLIRAASDPDAPQPHEPFLHNGRPVAFHMNYAVVNVQEMLESHKQFVGAPQDCGTVACIAGFCDILQNPNARFTTLCPTTAIAEVFGVDIELALKIAFPNNSTTIHLRSATAEHAINMLENLIATGEVRWVLD